MLEIKFCPVTGNQNARQIFKKTSKFRCKTVSKNAANQIFFLNREPKLLINFQENFIAAMQDVKIQQSNFVVFPKNQNPRKVTKILIISGKIVH